MHGEISDCPVSIRMAVADWISSGSLEEVEAEADFAWETPSNDAMAKQAADYRCCARRDHRGTSSSTRNR